MGSLWAFLSYRSLFRSDRFQLSHDDLPGRRGVLVVLPGTHSSLQYRIQAEAEQFHAALRLFGRSFRRHDIYPADSRFEFPAISLEALRLPDNILIFRNGVAISISPRNEKLEDGKTVEDIENLIQRA